MPRPKKVGWERVTITISPEVASALRVLSACSGREMGVIADSTMRLGGLFKDLDHAQGKEPLRLP